MKVNAITFCEDSGKKNFFFDLFSGINYGKSNYFYIFEITALSRVG